MIVLSILTALALERGAVSLQNAASAQASRMRIEAEIASIRSDLVTAKKSNEEHAAEITVFIKSLAKAMAAGQSNNAAVADIAKQAMQRVAISIPDYPRDAWESAIADQSASHLGQADLARFSKIYTEERNEIAFEAVLLQGGLIEQLANIGANLQTGKVDGQDLSQALTHYALLMKIIDANDDGLIAIIDQKAGS
jgi:hypothetical protein